MIHLYLSKPPFSLLVSIPFIFLSFFLYFCFLFLISFQLHRLHSFVYLFHSFSNFLFDVNPPTLSSSFSCDPAVINRCLFGRWSVRNGRCNARSQLLQAFPGLASPLPSAALAVSPTGKIYRPPIRLKTFKPLWCRLDSPLWVDNESEHLLS